MPRITAFVLLHSPVLWPSAWHPVARELKRRGRRAVVPSLIGHAVTPSWRHSLATVRDAMRDSTDPMVLVAHSGAGPLLPAIAVELGSAVAGLVFVDASLPAISGTTPLLSAELMERLRG